MRSRSANAPPRCRRRGETYCRATYLVRLKLLGTKKRRALYAWVGCAAALVACSSRWLSAAERDGYQSYRLRHAQVADVEPLLSKLLPDLGVTNDLVVDGRENQFLLRGTPEAHRLTEQLLESLDRPAAQTKPTTAVLRAYPFSGPDPAQVATRLQERLGGSPAVRVTADARSGQLFVVASPQVQQRVPEMLASLQGDVTSPRTTVPTVEPGEPVLRFVELRNSEVRQIEPMLLEMFQGRVTPQQEGPAGLSGVRLGSTTGEPIELGFNLRYNQIAVRGPTGAVDAAVRLLEALDSPPQPSGKIIRIMPLGNADLSKVRRATDAFQGLTPKRKTRQKSSDERRDAPAEGEGAERSRKDATRPASADGNAHDQVEFAHLLFQPPDAGQPAAEPLELDPEEMLEEEEMRERLRQLGADVEVETLPDLDVIILRGDERDVNELIRIIQEIERISAEIEPVVEVIELEHAPGDAMAAMLAEVQVPLLAGRQGRVTVTPLVKPNALLLVGWGDALEVMRDLIGKLDRPVEAETQLRVFRLRHAAAVPTGDTIEEFFANREGLGPRVIVSADQPSNSLVVQAAPRDMAEVELLIARLDVGGSEAVDQLRVFRLRNTLAEDLANVLEAAFTRPQVGVAAQQQRSSVLQFLTIDAEGRRLIESGQLANVRFTPDPRTNTLLVSAPAETIELIAAVIEQLDSLPATVAQIKVFRIVNGDASALVEMLRNLLGPQAAVVPGPRLGTAGDPALAPIRFSVDTRTNTIIASGPAGELEIIEAILLRLDESDEQQRRSTVYRLKNAPSTEVAISINEFLRSERLVQFAVPGVASPFEQIEREVVVVPERVSNSLIISATPRYYDEIIKLVEELDAQPPQVMIQVLIAEVQLNNFDEFGVELGIQDTLLFDRSVLQAVTSGGEDAAEIIDAIGDPGYNFNNEELGNSVGLDPSNPSRGSPEDLAGQALSHFAVGRINSELGYGGLVLSASSQNISILLRALRETRRLQVLSRPQVMTVDNQPAFIQVGQRVPLITQSNLTQFGQQNVVELENVGLILAVTPRISPEGMVVMEVDAEKSAVDRTIEFPVAVAADGQAVLQPGFSTTTAQTTVSAASGQTIVIGGLITTEDATTSRRVPLLSDIPILGHLFRYDSKRRDRRELLIILTPHVVRSREEAERLKQIESARMSWCLADVEKLHGECGICNRGDCEHCLGDTQVIYPDVDPTGTMLFEDIPGGLEEVPGPEMVLPPPEPPEQAPVEELPNGFYYPPLPSPTPRELPREQELPNGFYDPPLPSPTPSDLPSPPQ